MTSLQIVGRRSSHFTRLTRIFAEELGLSYDVVPIYDMTAQDSAIYANNPALKLPILRIGEDVVFGTENICRAIADRAQKSVAIVWPEQLAQQYFAECSRTGLALHDLAGADRVRHGDRQAAGGKSLLREGTPRLCRRAGVGWMLTCRKR